MVATEHDAPAVEAPPGMVLVPPGPFLFGKKKEEVALAGFWIDVYPVTNEDYLQYCHEHRRPSPRHWPPDGLTSEMLKLPVVFLTYAEAEAYATALGKQLPTPAQFEKAARGTDGRKYPWGESTKQRAANTREAGIGALTPVDRFPRGASPYGCFDMCGNVLHWTRALYDAEKGTRLLKGSSFRHYQGTTFWDYEQVPSKREDFVGLRCVKSVE